MEVKTMRPQKEWLYITVVPVLVCVLLYISDQIFKVSYIERTLMKLLLFLAVPIFYARHFQKTIRETLHFQLAKPDRLSLLLGRVCFVLILVSYFILKNQIDFESIMAQLQTTSKVHAGNYLLVGLYITIVNSLLEELFFRGFLFLNLYQSGRKVLAYGYSSVLFALYHLSIFKTWFDPLIMLLALFGLVAAGLLFDALNVRKRSIYSSWLVHAMADAAIILVGLHYI